MQSFRKDLSRHFPPLGKVIRVNSAKKSQWGTSAQWNVPLIYRQPHTRNLNMMQTNRFPYEYAANESIHNLICKGYWHEWVGPYNVVCKNSCGNLSVESEESSKLSWGGYLDDDEGEWDDFNDDIDFPKSDI